MREDSLERPGLAIKFGIFHRDLMQQVIRVGTRPTFHNMHGVAVWMSVIIDPAEFVFESDRVDHQRIALPFADAIPEKRRLDVLRMVAPIHRYRAPRGHKLVEK